MIYIIDISIIEIWKTNTPICNRGLVIDFIQFPIFSINLYNQLFEKDEELKVNKNPSCHTKYMPNYGCCRINGNAHPSKLHPHLTPTQLNMAVAG